MQSQPSQQTLPRVRLSGFNMSSTTVAPSTVPSSLHKSSVEELIPPLPAKAPERLRQLELGSGLLDNSHDGDHVQLDGGITAWSQVFVSFLLVLNGFGYFSSFGLFESHWTETLNSTASDIAWVGSLSLFLLFMLGSLSGPLMDMGYFRSLIVVGCSFQILGAFTTSAVTSYWQLILAQGIVQGIGNGLLFTPCVALVSVYFTKKKAFALSLAACGAPFGGIIFPLMARQLTEGIGYPWTIRLFGFIMLFNTILILVLARPRSFKSKARSLVDLAAFKDPVYLIFSIGIFFTLWGLYIAYFYTSTYGKTVIGISQDASLNLLLVLNAVGIPGRVIPAFLADRWFGPFNTMLPFVAFCSIMLFAWMRVDTSGGFYAWVAIYGVCANAVQTLFPSTTASLITDPSKTGQRIGMVFSVASFACLTGPPLAGALIGIGNGDYVYMQLYGGVSVIIGFGCLVVSRVILARQK
ncbi:major facilitator superfamily domain-containing protein [Coniella lustricola]|uniref:Major facilitator superfamily domain-containing protein n=1 Tax=Coniella lustricola TaxID=2025994 RepID=A0A2T3A0R2_9PEZI|nr:major facilitator superfamily domain-containing protein [Coniella lustricola]